jgi:GntR family transcriptional repressor for pyruvate dehydrogenase complex
MSSDLKAGTDSDDGPPGVAAAVLAPLRPAQRQNLARHVTDELLALIAAAGSSEVALPSERVLCTQLEVSRNVLREALSALDRLGVVQTRGKVRVGQTLRARAELVAKSVTDVTDRRLLRDPIEVRVMLEPEVAALAARRASKGALREIERWIRLMEVAFAHGDRLVEYDAAFHISIARATGNQTLVELVTALADVLKDSREMSFSTVAAGETALLDHRAIAAALRRRDAAAARAAMGDHLGSVASLIRASVQRTAVTPVARP